MIALSGLLLLVGSGCVEDVGKRSAHGNGGAGAAQAGQTGTSGAPPTGGDAPSEAGEGGAGGEPDEPTSAGRGGRNTGGRGGAGSGGKAAIGGGSCVANALTTCAGVNGCVDLSVGTPADNGVTNCGACGTTCALDNATSATCAAAVCALTCSDGFGDCNATTANDGCESVLTTAAHCGSCQNACSRTGVASTQCTAGACAPTCAPSYADCNGSTQPAPNDGCEFFYDALDHCTTGCTDAFVACDATQVCNAGSCVAPNGIAVLSTPLNAIGNQTRFSDIFPGYPLDLTGSSVQVRVYAPGATGGTLKLFMSDNTSSFGAEVVLDLASLNQKWTDVSVPVVGLNVQMIKQVNLLVTADGTYANPTVLYVDSVRTTNLLANETFDSSAGGFVKSSMVVVDGASVSWTAAMP